METYIRSMACYAILSYLLGIGDRHLGNIMINDKGKMFHIDFGYLFGNEPNSIKQFFSSLIWISPEMVNFLTIDERKSFNNKLENLYKESWKHKNLILNSIYLLIHSGLPQLPVENSEYLLKNIHERFMP